METWERQEEREVAALASVCMASRHTLTAGGPRDAVLARFLFPLERWC